MAAFSFPENPNNGDTTENSATGLVYVFRSSPSPGKWEVQMADSQSDFVNVVGDTMTGQLRIFTDDVNLGGNLYLKSSTLANKNLNHLLYCESTNSSPMFGVTNDGYVTSHHNLQCTSSTAFFTSGGSPNNTPGYCAFSILGPAVGDTTNVPYPSRLSPILKTWYNFDGTGTAVRYFGMQVDDNDIVNKAYVDAIALTSGGTITATGGSVDTSGNLTIKQSTSDSQDGRLYLKGSDNTSNISLYGAGGGIDMKGSLSFNSTSNTKNIRAYGASSPVIKFLTGAEASSVGERMSISSSGVSVVNNLAITGDQIITATGGSNPSLSIFIDSVQSCAFGSSFTSFKQAVTANVGLTVLANGITVNAGTSLFKDTIQSSTANVAKFTRNGNKFLDIQDALYVYGLNSNGSRPSWEAIQIGIDPNNENFSAMTIGKRMYWSGGYVYFNGSVRNYLNNNIWDFRDNDTNNNILTEINSANKTFNIGCSTTITAPTGDFTPGLTIKTTNNTTTLWNATQPGHLRFQTTSGSNGGTCGIQVQGDSGSPSFTMTLGAPGYSLDRVFSYSYSATYGKRVYMYPDWGQSYNNASNLPDATPVTLGYLRNQGLVTQAFTSVVPSNDPNDLNDSITTQTSVSVGAQMQLDGRLTTGRGFSLSGCTTDQPTNTSAICLQLYHEITAAAQLLYRGDTTSDNDCVQTKASTLSLIQGHTNTFTNQNHFHADVTIGTSSTGRLLDVFKVLRVRANSNNDLTGFNNGAVLVNDKTGATVAAMYDTGLYSAKKLVFESNTASQDIYLKGANRKGLNIKYDDSGASGVVLATFDPDGSTLNSQLDLNLNKIVNVGTATSNADAANKLYVDNSIISAFASDQSIPNLTLTGTTALTINNSSDNAGIKFTSTQAVQLL